MPLILPKFVANSIQDIFYFLLVLLISDQLVNFTNGIFAKSTIGSVVIDIINIVNDLIDVVKHVKLFSVGFVFKAQGKLLANLLGCKFMC